MNILAVDPGKTNLGIWYGSVSVNQAGKIVPLTKLMEKIDLGKGPLYRGAIDCISAQMSSGTMDATDMSAVVETQDPNNMPARVVAYTLYGYFHGMKVDAEFSSSRLKNDAMDILAKQYDVQMVAKPTKESEPDAKKRRRMMHAANKKNSKAIVFKMLDELEESELSSKIASARDPQGRKKADDMTDALLLGIGLWIKKTKYGRLVKQKKVTTKKHIKKVK